MRRPRQVPLPAELRRALESILGTRLDEVAVIEHSWLTRLHGRAVATTRRGRIYLRGSAADFFADARLLLHEYCHVVHQWQPGTLTLTSYLMECLRRGYWNNHFEVEARAFADLNIERLHALMKRAGASAEQRLAPIEPCGHADQERPE
jgi:hypothetical protein